MSVSIMAGRKGLCGSSDQLFRWVVIGKACEERLKNGLLNVCGDKERTTEERVVKLTGTRWCFPLGTKVGFQAAGGQLND